METDSATIVRMQVDALPAIREWNRAEQQKL